MSFRGKQDTVDVADMRRQIQRNVIVLTASRAVHSSLDERKPEAVQLPIMGSVVTFAQCGVQEQMRCKVECI
jgi:hypothetical protein